MFANFAFELNVDVAFSEFKQLVTYLESAAKDPTSTDEVERKLFDGLSGTLWCVFKIRG